MQDPILSRAILIIENTLNQNRSPEEAVKIGPEDSMETVAAWDSLSFVSIFLALNEEFGLDVDADEAIHYRSVPAIVDYVSRRI